KHMSEAGTAADQPSEGQYFLAWDMTVITFAPNHSWRILLDAMTGSIINVIDLAQYATGSGRVFDPNPIVVSGNTTLSSTTPTATLDGLTNAVVLDHLNPAAGGNYLLDGSFVDIEDFNPPTFAEPTSPLADFIFSFNNRNFLAVMGYYHLDRFQ